MIAPIKLKPADGRSEKNGAYRFSGHETFACRYAWLPKAAHALGDGKNQDILTTAREDDAMVELGVGKNMVRSIRFWAEAGDIISSTQGGHTVTDFGRELLLGRGRDEGFDPYLEDIQTLWLIHWKLSTNPHSLIFAWDFLLNQFQEPELYASSVVKAFEKAAPANKSPSKGSLEQLYDVFIHSYVPTRGKKGEVREDNLDCPLVELDLLQRTGLFSSTLHEGRVESKYAFRREEKPEISRHLFAYCLNEFWNNRQSKNPEQTLPFHSIVSGHGSPGQVFKIPEADIRSRLLGIDETTDGYFVFEESAAIPRIVMNVKKDAPPLANVYSMGVEYAC